MSERLVTLARQRNGLVAVVSLADQDESGLRCALVRKRIEDIDASLCPPAAKRAVEAWRNLARVRVEDTRSIASALTVLLETVPIDGEESARRFRPPMPTRSIRRTAAHPRGWGGGKPLRSRMEDLREVLSAPGAWRSLRSMLRQERTRVFPLLRDVGFDGSVLESLVHARDPYVAYHHRAPAEPGLAALPCSFRTTILPLLRSRSWGEIRQSLSLYWALDLERDEGLLALVAHLLSLASIYGRAWWSLLPAQVPERRGRFIRILLDSGAYATDPTVIPAGSLLSFARLDEPRYEDRLMHLLAGLLSGVSPSHMLEGFRLADSFAPDHRFVSRWRCKRYTAAQSCPGVALDLESRLQPILLHIADATRADCYDSFPIVLWERCAQVPAVAGLLTRPSLLEYPGETTFLLLRLLVDDVDSRLSVAERASAAESLLVSTPATHHRKALEGLEEVFDKRPRPEECRALLPAASVLLARLSRPPFKSEGSCGKVVAQLLDAAGPRSTPRLLSATDRSFLRLERVLKRYNDAELVHAGFDTLAERMGRFMIEAFIAHPEALSGAARLLGGVSAPRRFALLKRFRSHPVLQRRFLRLPLEEICRVIEALAGPGIPNPIPRKLRQHLLGETVLTPGSVERHRQAIVRGLVPLKLGLLRRMILQDLARGLGHVDLGSSSERHALQMLGSVRTNRRLLRRLLCVAPASRTTFLVEHPANRAWLRRHRRVDADLWIRGVEKTAELPPSGWVRLAIETDPLEVLRLGTEVGSCLSVGGACEDSAVDVMADINKQVVFARRPDGSFVARQVVAIGEDDRLVFFPVYPLQASSAIKDLFYEYDLSLAAAMGLEAFRGPSDAEYNIARIIGRYFYDDGLWDRFRTCEPALAEPPVLALPLPQGAPVV